MKDIKTCNKTLRNAANFKCLQTTLKIEVAFMKKLTAEFKLWECLLPFGPESSVFCSAIQKYKDYNIHNYKDYNIHIYKDYNIHNYNLACCFVQV
jgi:hypothetical protein